MEKFPFYRKSSSRWQNSLRHNLSYNDCFVKISKGHDQGGSSGKGSYWTLHQSSSQMFQEGSYLRRKRRFHDKEESGGAASGADDEMNSDSSNQSVSNRTVDDSLSGGKQNHHHHHHDEEKEDGRSIYTEKNEYMRSSPSHYTRFTIDSILDNSSKKDNNTHTTSHHIPPTTTTSPDVASHHKLTSHKLSSGTTGVRFNNNMAHFDRGTTNCFTRQLSGGETTRNNFKRTNRLSTYTEQHTNYNNSKSNLFDTNS